MRRPRILTLFSAAILLPLLVASVVAGHDIALLCRNGAVMSLDDCCPAEHAEAAPEPPAHASLVDEPCCTVVTVELARPVSDRHAEAAPNVAPPLVAFAFPPSQPATAPLSARGPAIRAHGPPYVRPPLVLLKSSFLI